MQGDQAERIDAFIAAWRDTGGSELANTQSFVNGLCDILAVPTPDGSRAGDATNDYVFERRVFADNGDGTTSFGRIDCYRRGAFILEAKHKDALIDYAEKVIERDADGQPVSRWDGETMKPHPVTGKPVPDEAARVESWRYVGPSRAQWPSADFIVGNPPFIGGKDIRDRLGSGYFEALFKVTDVPESADFVMHWWDRVAKEVRAGRTRRFGFVTTNSITQVFSPHVVAKHLEAKNGLALAYAIPNHPWVDEKDGAAVRIAMTVGVPAKDALDGRLRLVTDESQAPAMIDFEERLGRIGLVRGVELQRNRSNRTSPRTASADTSRSITASPAATLRVSTRARTGTSRNCTRAPFSSRSVTSA